MSSHTEQIEDELAGIQAVLAEDYNLISDFNNDNHSHCFRAFCFPSDDLDDCHCSVQLEIKIPNDYPNTIPSIQLLSRDGISQNTADKLLDHLHHKLTDEVGEEMLYLIIDLTKEYLINYNFIGAHLDDETAAHPLDDGDGTEGIAQNGSAVSQITPGMDGDGNTENTVDPDFNDVDDAGFSDYDDSEGGWDAINVQEDDMMFTKSLESIQKIEEQKVENQQHQKNKTPKMEYDILTLDEVIGDDITSPTLQAVADTHQMAWCNRSFYGECRRLKDGEDSLEIRIGIQIAQYIESGSVLRVLGLWDNEYLVIRLRFDSDYINTTAPPQVIEVGKSVPHKFDKKHPEKENGPIRLRNKLEAFTGSRSIQNRIGNKLFARYWPPTKLQTHFPMKYKEILQLMAVTGLSFEECKETLYDLKDYEKTLVYLMGGDEEEEIEGVETECKSKDKKRGGKYCSNSNQNRKNRKSRKSEKRIVSKAMQLLCDELVSFGLSDFMFQCATKSKNQNDEKDQNLKLQSDSESKSESNSESISMEKQSVDHQLRSFLERTSPFFMHNVLLQILYFALHSTLTLSKRCLVCDKTFPEYSTLIKPTCCRTALCQFGHEELEIGLDIASMIKSSPEVIDLLITFFVIAVNHKRVSKPPLELCGLGDDDHLNFKIKRREKVRRECEWMKDYKEFNVLDMKLMKSVLDKFPSVDSMQSVARKVSG